MKGTLFGEKIDPDFDLGKEQRTGRVSWLIYAAVGVCGVLLIWNRPKAVEAFQIAVATILCYGFNFYVNRPGDFNEPWLWKTIVATIPMHFGYLGLLLWADIAAPGIMTKALVFMPALLVGLAIESLLIDSIVAHFKPRLGDRNR
jgi:hypothetical protein